MSEPKEADCTATIGPHGERVITERWVSAEVQK